MKKVLWLLLLCCLISAATAFNTTTFYDGSNYMYHNYSSGSDSPTKQISLPSKAYVTNAYLYLTGSNAGTGINYYTSAVRSLNNSQGNYTWTDLGQMFAGSYTPANVNDYHLAQDNNADSNSTVVYWSSEYLNINFTLENRTYKKVDYTLSGWADWVGNAFNIYCKNQSNGQTIFITNFNLNGNRTIEIPSGCYELDPTRIITSVLCSAIVGTYNVTIKDVVINATYENPIYPHNVSILLNNASNIFNYGSSNNSQLDHVILANITGGLNNITGDLKNLSFLSNTTGVLNASGLFVAYSNMLNISIYDESSLSLITDNLSLELSTGNNTLYYWTKSGTKIFYDEFNGTYDVAIYNVNYSKRRFWVSFLTGENEDLKVYMANATNTVTFTVKNYITLDILEGALISQYRLQGSEWLLLNSILSDINGQGQFTYATGVKYMFVASLSGYDTKVFYLDPITSTDYTIPLVPQSQFSTDSDHFGVYATWTPRIFYNNLQNNFTFTISSPDNILETYNLTLIYPGGSNTASGSNPGGESFGINFTITNALLNDTVRIIYSYDTTLGDMRTYAYTYFIVNSTSQPGSMAWAKSRNYGLGLLERLIIMIVISLIVGGSVMALAGMEAGMAIALIMQGVVAYLLAISVLFLIPSFIVGIIVISRRTG